MEQILDRLLHRFESGDLSRRELLSALSVLALRPQHNAASAPLPAAELNHVTLRVKDLRRSAEFYQRLLGGQVTKKENNVAYLRFGRGFMSLWQAPKLEPEIEHFCVGIQNLDRDRTRSELEKNGFQLRKLPNDPTIYVVDPDELLVQLEAPGFEG